MKKDRVITVRLEDPDFALLERKVEIQKATCDAASLASMARSLIVAGLRTQRNQRNHEQLRESARVSEGTESYYGMRRTA